MFKNNERKILTVCIVIAAISTVIQTISYLANPEAISLSALVSTGIVPIVLIISLLSLKKDDEKK